MKYLFFCIAVIILSGCSSYKADSNSPQNLATRAVIVNSTLTTIPPMIKTLTPTLPPTKTKLPISFPIPQGMPLTESLKVINAENINNLILVRKISTEELYPYLFTMNFSPDSKYLAMPLTINQFPQKFFWICNVYIGNCEAFDGSDAVFSTNGKMIAIYYDGFGIKIWSQADRKPIESIKTFEGFKRPIYFSPDSEKIAINTANSLNIYQISDWSLVKELPSRISGGQGSVNLSPDWSTYVTGEDRYIRSLSDGTIIGDFGGFGVYSSTGAVLVNSSRDFKKTQIWQVLPFKQMYNTILPCVYWFDRIPFSPKDDIYAVTVNTRCWPGQTGDLVMIASERNGVISWNKMEKTDHFMLTIWRTSDGQLLRVLDLGENDAVSRLFSPDGKLLVIVAKQANSSPKYEIQLWGVP